MGNAASAEEIVAAVQKGAMIIDCRTASEFSGYHHPRAVNMPLDQFDSKKLPADKSKPIVVHCQSGMRSATFAQKLKDSGYTQIVDAGGISNLMSAVKE